MLPTETTPMKSIGHIRSLSVRTAQGFPPDFGQGLLDCPQRSITGWHPLKLPLLEAWNGGSSGFRLIFPFDSLHRWISLAHTIHLPQSTSGPSETRLRLAWGLGEKAP